MFRSYRYALLAGLLIAPAAGVQAQSAEKGFVSAGDFLVRARGIVVEPDEGAEISVIGGGVDIGTSVDPEFDFSYFLTDNFALELIAAVPRHDVDAVDTAAGNFPIAEVRLLPPTLTLQYHYPVTERFKPYVGAGINVTFFIDEDPRGPVVTDIDADTAVAPAIQAGFDYQISGPWMINLDVKKLFLDTDVSLNGGVIEADVDIDPWIFGFGIGYRF